jgi:hypothetical protein
MTNNLIAKPVVNNQYWIVTDGKHKVGNVLATGSGFEVKIGNKKKEYPNTKSIATKEHIEFVKPIKGVRKETNPYSTYPTGKSKVFNSILDVKRKIHVFTKTSKSKCFHAAGWFVIKQGSEMNVVLCPKYIFVQRYESFGPFETQSEANDIKDMINSL